MKTLVVKYKVTCQDKIGFIKMFLHTLNMLQLFCVAIINCIYLQVIQKQLKHFWCKGVSSSRRIQLGSKFMAIKVDATSLAVGLEDGSIELWERVGKFWNTPLEYTFFEDGSKLKILSEITPHLLFFFLISL